jgi:Arc/MetJ-type ribon-helix-helix transcriptional regulator
MDHAVSEIDKKSHVARAARTTVSAVRLSQSLTAAIDAWAETHHLNRSDAIRQLVELALKAAPAASADRTVRQHSGAIEHEAISRISGLLDPLLPTDERERRIRRLIEGPPEFTEQRRDLPRYEK